MRTTGILIAVLLQAGAPVEAERNPAAEGFDQIGSDARAIEVADAVMERLGGRPNWDNTRYIAWRFFGRRFHVWDKWTGDLRYEAEDGHVVLMNIHSRQGKAWEAGQPVTDPDSTAARIEAGYRAWINDSYWLVMPYKLKDTGVTLKYKGVGETEAGEPSDILELTFTDVGVTPQNKYDVYVDREERLVRQWAFYADADDQDPRFTSPWSNWRQYGDIWLADDPGRYQHTDVAVYDELPRALFEDPKARYPRK